MWGSQCALRDRLSFELRDGGAHRQEAEDLVYTVFHKKRIKNKTHWFSKIYKRNVI